MKNKSLVLLLLLGAGFVFVCPEIAHAADAAETSETVNQSIAELLSIVMDFLNALLWPFLIIIGDLMDTDLILGPGMEERLKSIWIPVRDLVNIAFAVVLLVVAFYNVLGLGGGEGDLALKTALPKIVLGLVLVNFTFIAGKVVLDLVNVATTAAFALPELASTDDAPYDFGQVTEEFTIKVCHKPDDEATEAPTYWNEDLDDDVPIYTRLFCQKNEDTAEYDALDASLQAQYFTNLNANNIGLVMAVNMGGLSSLSLLKEEGITTFSDISISIMFAVVMYLVFATSYLVLGIVLLTRLIVLWIALALSPLAVLVYVVPQIKEWAGGGGDFVSKIIKHLIAPIIIGVTMSMGYILISAWDGLAGGSLEGGGFKVDDVISTEFLISGIDDLPQFIIALASIVIVWTGVFAAASDTYASFATDAIKGFGERVRDAAFKAPTLLSTIPVGVKNDENQYTSLASLQGLVDTGLRQLEYGTTADAQTQALINGNPILKGWLGNNTEGGNVRDPKINARNIQDTLAKKDASGNLLYTDAAQIANYLYHTIEEKSTATDKAALLKTVQDWSTNGVGNVTELKTVLQRSATDLGIEELPVYREIQKLANSLTGLTATPPAQTKVTPPPAPTLHDAVTPAVTAVASLATTKGTDLAARNAERTAARTAIATARNAGITATDTSSSQTLDALAALVEAEEAMDAYATALVATPSGDHSVSKNAAKEAISKARTAATSAAHKPSIERANTLYGQL